jgi:hypothetical protein
MTTATRRAYWGVLVTVFALVFSMGLFAQSRPAAGSTSPSPVAHDLNTTLAELMRAAPATSQDLTNLQHQGGKLHWVTFWQGDKQKAKMTAALRRNLQFAVPDLIHDAQASGGSVSTTFKLYRDLTVVCESLDSLLPPGSREGKTELTALSNDLSEMNRIREELSSHIQRAAASMDSKTAQLASAAGHSPKKVIVDDNVPEKPSPRKRHPSHQ